MGESASKEHWKNCYGTLDDFIQIDDRIGDIFYGFAVTADYTVCRMVYPLLSFQSFLIFSLFSFLSFVHSLSLSLSLSIYLSLSFTWREREMTFAFCSKSLFAFGGICWPIGE
jgi:hypothetical protein